jgi:flagellar basal body rod protein FlgF
MKVEINKDGWLVVKAETITEAWALNGANIHGGITGQLAEDRSRSRIILDCSILLRDNGNE